MLSLYVSAAQCDGYTAVLILNLWVEGQWDFAVGCGKRREVVLFPLIKFPSVLVLQQFALWGCTECNLFPFSSSLGLSVCVLRGWRLWLHLGAHWTFCCRNKRHSVTTRPFSESAAYRSHLLLCTGLSSLDWCLLPKLRAVFWVRQNSAETGCHHPCMVDLLREERLGSQQVAHGTGNCLDVMLNVWVRISHRGKDRV